MSYAAYTEQFNDFLRRFRKHMTYDHQCVRFICGLAHFQLQTQAKSHRSQKAYTLKFVEQHNFLNDVVTDSTHMGGVQLARRQHMEAKNRPRSALVRALE
jgi:hypothetical protein